MKRFFLLVLCLITISFPFKINSALAQNKNSIEGTWLGTLNVSGMELRIVFRVQKSDGGIYSVLMDSPDQGAKDIPVDNSVITDSTVRFEVKMINGFFKGRREIQSDMLIGSWNQAGMSFPLTLHKTNKVENKLRPQEPAEPYPYKIEEVYFNNYNQNITLAGTLTIPEGEGSFPAVVLISGSGPQNRDEEIFNHRPFKVIADYLTRNGIAVLRYDDRGIGKSTGNFSTSTTKDFALDAQSAVKFLKTRPEIDNKKIGLIGHSEGGIIAPIVASENNDIDFIILLAAPGISGEELLYLQTELISKSFGKSDEQIQKDLEFNKNVYSVIKQDGSKEKMDQEILKLYDSYYKTMTEEQKSDPSNSKEYFENSINTLTSPWFRYFLTYDPKPVLEKVKCPVLALYGENDLQVPPIENKNALQYALKAGGNENFDIIVFPKLNHLFQTSNTGAISEYAKIEETFSPQVLKTIKDWITKVAK